MNVRFAWLGVGGILCASASAQVTERISVSTGGTEANGPSFYLSVSGDGRFVAFQSEASNLTAGDTNGFPDVFVRDRSLGVTELVSISATGGMASGGYPSITADGRYVAFYTPLPLVVGDTNGVSDIFVRDRQAGTTERVSISSGGTEGLLDSYYPSISADGRFVAFTTASALVAGDTNGVEDIYLRDRLLGTTERVSIATGGTEGDAPCHYSVVSADGRFVAFESAATNLVAGDMNGVTDIFIRDRQIGTTERVSVSTGGSEGTLASENPTVSADGRYVAFQSRSFTLVPNDTNAVCDIFVRDRQLVTTALVSVATSGAQGTVDSSYPSISASGRYIAFYSGAPNLVSNDTNGAADVFVRDQFAGTTERVNIATDGTEANGAVGDNVPPSISADGRFVAFSDHASSLVQNDTNGVVDVFLRDRDASVFESLCEPGTDGIIACPCGNPPSGSGRGCNNFAPSGGTGGAMLAGSGLPSIAADSVSLDISDTLKQIHVLFVGTALSANVRAGAGVRCVGGGQNPGGQTFFKRIAKQTPTNGPPSSMSFTGIEAASVAKGAPPIAGQTYYYYAAYRNSAANGQSGCPGLSFGFNATNAGAMTWYP